MVRAGRSFWKIHGKEKERKPSIRSIFRIGSIRTGLSGQANWIPAPFSLRSRLRVETWIVDEDGLVGLHKAAWRDLVPVIGSAARDDVDSNIPTHPLEISSPSADFPLERGYAPILPRNENNARWPVMIEIRPDTCRCARHRAHQRRVISPTSIEWPSWRIDY